MTTNHANLGNDVLACGRSIDKAHWVKLTSKDIADINCGNCKRSRAFKDAVKSGMETLADMLSLDNGTTPARIVTIPSARSRYTDAGFFASFTGTNHRTCQNFGITSIDRIGSCVVTATGWDAPRTFASLTDLLIWLIPADMNAGRILDCVIGDGMTFAAAVDMEWQLAAERASVDAIEYAVNDALMSRIRGLACGICEDNTPWVSAHLVKRPIRTNLARRARKAMRNAAKGA